MSETILNVLVIVGVMLVSIVLSIIGYFIRDLRASVKEQLREHRTDIDQVRHDCARCQANLPRLFVLKEDFVRMSAAIDRKIDLLHEEVRKIVRYFQPTRGDEPGVSHGRKG